MGRQEANYTTGIRCGKAYDTISEALWQPLRFPAGYKPFLQNRYSAEVWWIVEVY
jgi:hypothetical protein